MQFKDNNGIDVNISSVINIINNNISDILQLNDNDTSSTITNVNTTVFPTANYYPTDPIRNRDDGNLRLVVLLSVVMVLFVYLCCVCYTEDNLHQIEQQNNLRRREIIRQQQELLDEAFRVWNERHNVNNVNNDDNGDNVGIGDNVIIEILPVDDIDNDDGDIDNDNDDDDDDEYIETLV